MPEFRLPVFFLFLLSLPTLNAEIHDLSSTLARIEALQNKSIELSPELKITRSARSQKKAESYTRLTDFFPQASFLLRKEKDFFIERSTPLRALGIGGYDSSWGIDYRWILFNKSAFDANKKTSAERKKTELDLENKMQEYPIAFNTYLLQYLLSKYKMAAVENSIKKAETGKKEATLGFELGQKTKLDVLRSEANLVSLQAKKTTYSDEEQNSKSQLLLYSGLEAADIDFLSHLDEIQIIQLINTLSTPATELSEPEFHNSPLLERLSVEESINKLSLSAITSSQWPELRIQGNYNNMGDDFKEAAHNPYRTHALALVLTIPLFGGGNFISSHYESYFAKKQVEYSIAQKKLETKDKLNNTLIKIKALKTLVNSLSLNVSQFEELYRLTSKSYQLGKSTMLELLEVQDNLLESKISLAQNKIQFYTLSQNYLWQAGLK